MPKRARAADSPDGLSYREDAVSPATAARALAWVRRPENAATFGKVRSTSTGPNKRAVFGPRYYLQGLAAQRKPSVPMPDELRALADEAVVNLGLAPPPPLCTCTVNVYPPGTGVGAHHDGPDHSPLVVGVTLLTDATPQSTSTMRFSTDAERHDVATSDRSAYLMSGEAYTRWKHERVPSKGQKGLAWSFTFRAPAGAAE
jgi:alkylated DNA repair dioxygenase AlkB